MATEFYYETEERKVICNGEIVWTLIPDDDECYIDNLSDLDNAINPSEIFTIWEDGFNYKYIKKEQNIFETSVQIASTCSLIFPPNNPMETNIEISLAFASLITCLNTT